MEKRNNIFVRFTMWGIECWRLVMDNRYNPLKYIPDPSLQTYFTMVLFTMWSVYFGFFATFYMGWYGYSTITSIIVHMGVLLPIAFTNAVFIDAERDGAKWLNRWKLNKKLDTQDSNLKKSNFEKRIKWDIDREA
mgnify:FL=1